jgi:2-polyprenylphenol 6-hydroxylase
MKSVDIAIIGGGIVGLAIAVGLKESGLRIAVLEQNEPETLTPDAALRVSALNLAAENFLQRLGAWNSLVRKQPYTQMAVWERNSHYRLQFDAASVMQPHLGHIIENRAIIAALWQQLTDSSVTVLRPCPIVSVSSSAEGALILPEQGEPLLASLIVGADGAHSRLRQQFNFPLTQWDYGHSALVATIETALPHGNCARQLFQTEGPLALLPLWQSNLCSIVWSVSPQRAQQLQSLPPAEFNKLLTIASDGVLGSCQLVSERALLPLKARYARDIIKDRCILVGDAAHTVHPLAGQGVNLGLMDAAALVEAVMKQVTEQRWNGETRFLAPYVRWRKTEAVQMLLAMEGIKRLFTPSDGLSRQVRDLGMGLLDRMMPMKQQLIRQAMGLAGEIPALAKRHIE